MSIDILDEAKCSEEEAKAAALLSRCRSHMLINHESSICFFSSLAMRLKLKPDWTIQTAYVDGVHLGFNPLFIQSLTQKEIMGLVVHEVLHIALLHQVRKGHRNHEKFNVAADLSINDIVLEAGLTLPKDVCIVGQGPFENFPKGLSAEQYYDILPDAPPNPNGGVAGYGVGCGEVRTPGDGSASAVSESEGEWKVAVAQAQNAAKQRGNMSAGLARLVGEVLEPKQNYKEILREFLSSHAKNDSTWRRPNRRFIHENIYLPSNYSEELGDIAIALDTSGSIGAKELQIFASELEAILGAYRCSCNIIYFDAAVHNEHTWETSDGPLVLQPKGGGGTRFEPVFEWVENHEKEFVCLVVLTDLFGSFPKNNPEVSTLWVTYANPKGIAPFGRTIPLSQ